MEASVPGVDDGGVGSETLDDRQHFRESSLLATSESRPALSTVGSASCSDNSIDPKESSPADSASVSRDEEVGGESRLSTQVIATNNDGQAPIDCLADNFTSLFCLFDDIPEDQTKCGSRQCVPSPQGCRDAAAESVQVDTSCASIPLDEILSNPGAGMLASFQSWLVPRGHEITARSRRRRNRASSFGRTSQNQVGRSG